MDKVEVKEVVWGIIGVGDVCEKKSAPAMNKIKNSRIKAVMRRNFAKAQDFAKRHKIPHVYQTVEEMLADEEINTIYIATPPHVHKELTIKAAKAGKNVYVEKPMALNYSECHKMNVVCEQLKTPLFVAYYRRALPNFLKVKELLQKKAIGQVRCVQINLFKPPIVNTEISKDENWRVQPEISGGGLFHDLASHQFDILDFILGKITSAKGHSTNQTKQYPADDMVTASYEFQSGVIGSGTWCFNSNITSEIDSIAIFGSKGMIEFATYAHGRVSLQCDDNEDEVFNFIMPDHIQQPLIETIVNDLRQRGKCLSTGKTGARASWVMDQICS